MYRLLALTAQPITCHVADVLGPPVLVAVIALLRSQAGERLRRGAGLTGPGPLRDPPFGRTAALLPGPASCPRAASRLPRPASSPPCSPQSHVLLDDEVHVREVRVVGVDSLKDVDAARGLRQRKRLQQGGGRLATPATSPRDLPAALPKGAQPCNSLPCSLTKDPRAGPPHLAALPKGARRSSPPGPRALCEGTCPRTGPSRPRRRPLPGNETSRGRDAGP
jgi:hypothetical protein